MLRNVLTKQKHRHRQHNHANLVRFPLRCLHELLWQVDIIAPSEAIRTERWKYLRYLNDPQQEELYDLVLDPLEINNLAADPLHQEILKKLRVKMEQKISAYQKAKVH